MKFLALNTNKCCIAYLGFAALLSASGANAQMSNIISEPFGYVVHTSFKALLGNSVSAIKTFSPADYPTDLHMDTRADTGSVVSEQWEQVATLDQADDVTTSSHDNHCGWPKRFNKKTDALAKVKRLSAEGVEATLSMQSISVRKGYQIKSPVFESVSQAKKYIEILDAAGMDDYYLPTFPGAVIQVALGSFYSGDKALSRLEHVLSSGLVASMTPWMIDVPAYTVSPIDWGSNTTSGCEHN